MLYDFIFIYLSADYFHRYLDSNIITFLPDRVFANLKNLWLL